MIKSKLRIQINFLNNFNSKLLDLLGSLVEFVGDFITLGLNTNSSIEFLPW